MIFLIQKHPIPKRLFLLHADTPTRAHDLCLPYDSPALCAGRSSLSPFQTARVIYALWCRKGRTDDECWSDFFRDVCRFRQGTGETAFALSVEDLRLLSGDLSRLAVLRAAGVRSAIPFWQGENPLGGAWDTEIGLSDFGEAAIGRCFESGLIPDVSHASRKSCDAILGMGETRGLPVIASHVGFDALCRHGRNLTDSDASRIASLGGLIGITFHAPHLAASGRADLSDVVSHIRYGFSRFPRAIALGSDFDGTEKTPDGLFSASDLPALAKALYDSGFTEEDVDAVFYLNAAQFFDAAGIST